MDDGGTIVTCCLFLSLSPPLHPQTHPHRAPHVTRDIGFNGRPNPSKGQAWLLTYLPVKKEQDVGDTYKEIGGEELQLAWGIGVRHPTPYTLHPTPHTLHPTPYTLHPTPYI